MVVLLCLNCGYHLVSCFVSLQDNELFKYHMCELCIDLFIYLSIYVFMCSCIYVFTFYLLIYLFIYLFMYLSMYLFVYLCIESSVFFFFRQCQQWEARKEQATLSHGLEE
jgi:hypothetical protein